MTKAERERMVEKVYAYLASPEGLESLRRGAEEAKKMADQFRKMRQIPWKKLHEPFTI